MVKITALVLIMTLSSLLCACSSSVRTGPIPQAGLTVSQLYHGVVDENETEIFRHAKRSRGSQSYKAHYEGALAEAFNNVAHDFKPLNNPAIPIYITPKVVLIGDEQIIKPGFVTQFYLFKKNQFALNSEIY